MCRRDSSDALIRKFLDNYQVNLLSMPGRRVACGSVYIQADGRTIAPGPLSDIVTPEITLGQPFVELDLADLSGTWSGSVSLEVGIGLLRSFLTALGAAGLIDKLQASVQQTSARKIAFRFRQVSRESLTPTGLGAALTGHHLDEGNSFVADGNRYFVVAAVLRSSSISVQGRDSGGSAASLGAGVATVADAKVKVKVEKESESEVTYHGQDELAIGVELYEMRWDHDRQALTLHPPKGALKIMGIKEPPPVPAFIGGDEDAFIAPEELPGESDGA
jgi:hypothetical protein